MPPSTHETLVLSDELRLVPVIQFGVASYARQERADPTDYADWPRYWEQCLADSGIHGLVLVDPASSFVALSQVTEPHVLRELLRVQLESVGEEERSQSALIGGQVLFDGERLVLTPRCCCCLNSLADWDAASRHDTATFYIGHPEAWADWEPPWVVLREYEDDTPGGAVLSEWRLSPAALRRAVGPAREEQQAFARRLEPLVAERFPAESVQSIAATLAGLD